MTEGIIGFIGAVLFLRVFYVVWNKIANRRVLRKYPVLQTGDEVIFREGPSVVKAEVIRQDGVDVRLEAKDDGKIWIVDRRDVETLYDYSNEKL